MSSFTLPYSTAVHDETRINTSLEMRKIWECKLIDGSHMTTDLKEIVLPKFSNAAMKRIEEIKKTLRTVVRKDDLASFVDSFKKAEYTQEDLTMYNAWLNKQKTLKKMTTLLKDMKNNISKLDEKMDQDNKLYYDDKLVAMIENYKQYYYRLKLQYAYDITYENYTYPSAN